MRRTIRFLPLLAVASITLTACEDAAGPAPPPGATDLNIVVPAMATAVPGTVDRAAVASDPGDDVDLPSGFDQPAGISYSRLDVGFSGNRAYALATMRFWGNRGLQKVDLDVWYGSTKVATRSASGSKREVLPGNYRIDTSTSISVSGSCGHTADGASDHRAWHEYGVYYWDEDSQQNHRGASQPDCVDEVDQEVVVPGGGSTGDDADWYICYYTHYYDSNTGRYLGSKFHGCEPL